MKIFNFAFGPYPQRVSIYLAEKGLKDVDVVLLDPPGVGAEWPPAALKDLTPSTSLPILIDDDGTVLGHSLAILEYLEDTRDGPDMRGRTPAIRARTREIVSAFDEALTFFGLWGKHGSRLGDGIERKSRDVSEICSARYFQKLRLIERGLVGSPFLAGDRPTIADCVAMATLQYTSDFYEVPIPDDCHQLSAWYVRFSTRPSVLPSQFPDAQHTIARGLMSQTGIGVPV